MRRILPDTRCATRGFRSRFIAMMRPIPPRPTATAASLPPRWPTIGSLDQEGRGVARVDGKAIFVEGALPGERVAITTLKRKPTYEIARVDRDPAARARRASRRAARTSACAAAARCSTSTPARRSPRSSARSRTRCGTSAACAPDTAAAADPRARRGATGIARGSRCGTSPKKGGVLVGFHERKSSYVADMTSCARAAAARSRRCCRAARARRRSLSIRDRLPQIELAVGDGATATVALGYVLVLRILEPLDAERRGALRDVRRRARRPVLAADRRSGDRGAVSCRRIATLAYTLPEFDLDIPVRADRVHAGQSARSTACWCGARWRCSIRGRASASPTSSAASATSRCRSRAAARPSIGVEGSAALVRRAEANRARTTASPQRATFRRRQPVRGHAGKPRGAGSARQGADRPAARRRDRARQGAAAATARPTRIVYVSCNPATLARDAACWSTSTAIARRGRRGQHVPAHRARRVDRAVRALTTAASARTRRDRKPRAP